jgi:hypothetical protein
MKNAKRNTRVIPGMDVTEKEDFYRLLHRVISVPSSPQQSAPKKPANRRGKEANEALDNTSETTPNT